MTLPSQSVSVRLPSDQPFFALIIAGLSCTLSLWLTLRFCRQLWPEEGGLLLNLLGLTWESAKMYFGPIGVRGLCAGGLERRFGNLVLATMALVLMAGSVVASMAYLSQADTQDQQRVLTSSRAYADSQKLLRSLDAQIDVLSVAADRDVAQNFRKRALATSDAISVLRRQRSDASAAITQMEAHPEALASTSFFSSLGALLPGDADANAKYIRCGAHGVIAVMLELIGVAALCVARARQVHPKAGPPLRETWSATGAMVGMVPSVPGAVAAMMSVPSTPVTVQSTSGTAPGAPGTVGTLPSTSCTVASDAGALGAIPGAVPAITKAPSALSTVGTVPGALGTVSTFQSGSVAPGTVDTVSSASDTMAGARGTAGAVASAFGTVAGTPGVVGTVASASGKVATVASTPRPSEATTATLSTADTVPSAPGLVRAVVADEAKSTSPVVADTPRPYILADELARKLREGRALVLQNQVRPTSRALKASLKMGQAAAQRLLTNMHADGLLKRTSRGYELVA